MVLEKKKFISNTTELICLYSRKEILMKDEELFHLYTFDIPIRNKAVFSTIFLLYSFQTLYLLYNLKYAQNYVLFRITNNKRAQLYTLMHQSHKNKSRTQIQT